MPAFQREVRRVVIEQGWLPLIGVVARGTIVLLRAELVCVRILVAFAASLGRIGKSYVHQRALQVRRLVAICAGHRAVRAHQRELRRVVVETRKLVPVPGVVADFAAMHLIIAGSRHSFFELPLMHVFVTGGAAQLREVVAHQLPAQFGLVAIVARNGDVAAREREGGLLVLLQREAGGLERGSVMAALALIEPRRFGELPLVLVLVAVHTARKGNLETRFLAGGNVALRALHLLVRKHQRVLRFRVILHGER